jgi:DNA polymerase-3 subunit beta
MPPLTGSVGSDALASAISQVAIAAGRDDTLPALTGIRIEISGDSLTLVATDRYRLAVRKLRWNPTQADLDTAVLVPARVLGETARALTSGAEVSISLGGDSLIGFAGAGRQTTTRLLSGEYPKYQSLLPNEFSATAELMAAPLAEAVKRVALVAERNTPVRLAFSDGQLVLEAGASEEAQAVEVVEASYDGEDLQIAFNPQYLLDGIGALDSDTARISFTSPTKPAVITGKNEGDPDYRYVLMPIRSAG